jgi:hypothetical protein
MRILWEMWFRIFFSFLLSSHSHYFVRRRNLVTDIKFIRMFYIFKENQSPILCEMWLGIFFTFILSSVSHHFVCRRNLVTSISSPSKYFIFLKKINRRFSEKCDLEYFSLSFFHLIHIILFTDGIQSPTFQVNNQNIL